MLPHLLDTLRQALMYAADVMEAADAVVAERSGASAQHAEVPRTCDGFEQPAFEEWAREHRYNMGQHPMFYVFLDRTTAGARAGWKAGLEYAVKKMSAGAAQPAKEQPHDR